jgi:hypothetical protein
MATARVKEVFEIFNNSENVYKEEYKGVVVTIPAKGSVFMDRRDKANFMGQYIPYDREREDGLKPLTARPAKNDKKPNWNPSLKEREESEVPVYRNEATGKTYPTKELLDESLKDL